jgi:ribonuclease PH
LLAGRGAIGQGSANQPSTSQGSSHASFRPRRRSDAGDHHRDQLHQAPEGSVLIGFGDTKVLVTASVEERVPPFLRGKGEGWVTAEYSMLPRATHTRGSREAAKGKQSGRTQEIQRLIGRPARRDRPQEAGRAPDHAGLRRDPGRRRHAHGLDLGRLGGAAPGGAEADGRRAIQDDPLTRKVAAISCGIVKGTPVLDLDYIEDSSADADANFVLIEGGHIAEVQATAEGATYDEEALLRLLRLARLGCNDIFAAQEKAVAR